MGTADQLTPSIQYDASTDSGTDAGTDVSSIDLGTDSGTGASSTDASSHDHFTHIVGQIFAKLPEGSTLTLDVKATDTTDSIKAYIAAKKKRLPPDQQRLIYTGRQLEAGRKLTDYNVQNEAVIYMGLKLSGGMEGDAQVCPICMGSPAWCQCARGAAAGAATIPLSSTR